MKILSDAPFYAPLKTSLILQNGSGNPTFTRATNRTVFDNEGILRTIPSGAPAFEGARLVRNFFTASGDMYNSSNWAVSNQSKAAASDPAGNSGAVTCTVTANTSNYLRQSYSVSAMPGTDKTFKILYKPGTSQWIRIFFFGGGSDRVSVWFNATTHVIGTVSTGGTGWSHISSALSASVSYPGWYELYVTYTAPPTGASFFVQIGDVDADGSTNTTSINGRSITWAFPQHENVTGRADKTPSEYLATGVLSAPYYGAGVDGVKYFGTNKDGSEIPASTLKRANLRSSAVTNTLLYCRDFTNAAWVKTNVTDALTQTGIDGQSNACSLLTASSANGTALQSITAAASAGCAGFYIKRSVGTGSVYITRDGGSNWTDITSLINSSTFTLCKIENTSVLNPQVGIKIAVSGDAVIVDYGINHLGTEIAHPILTTTTAVTVNAEMLTYQTSGNFSDTSGTIIATVERANWANNNGVVVGKSGSGLSTISSNSGVQALDGTNTVNGPLGETTVTMRTIGMRWSGTTMSASSDTNFGASGSYDGSFNLTTIEIMPQSNGYIGDVAIWQIELSDSSIINVVTNGTYGMNISAKSNLPPRQPANVIWSCLWDSSVVIGAPATAGAAYFFKSTVTGPDSRGNAGEDVAALFGTTGVFEIQYIIDPSETVLSDTFEITTPATTAPGGKGNEFVILQKKRTAAINTGPRPQSETMTYLSASTRRILCVRNKFMLPANLSDIFNSYAAGTNLRWMEFFSCKNGNFGDPNGETDSRFTIQAVRKRTNGIDETGMRYLFRFDLGNGGDAALIWQMYSDEGSLVPGVWHEYVIYIEQPESTSDLTNGVAKCMITNLVTGEVVANFSKQGGQFYGPLGRKLSRVTPQLCYTGGWPATGTIEIKWSDLEFGDNIRYPLI